MGRELVGDATADPLRASRDNRDSSSEGHGQNLTKGEQGLSSEKKYYPAMSIVVEVNLKIPSLTVRPPGADQQRIDNASVRFSTRVTVQAIPKPGDSLQLSTRLVPAFDATVTRADWSDDKNMFVVSCSYARRSIAEADYTALLNDPDWATKQLP